MSGETVGLPSARVVRALQTRLLAWYAENRRDLPWRRTADPYAILVSEIMLQQTQVPRVSPRGSSSGWRRGRTSRASPPRRWPTCCGAGRASATTPGRGGCRSARRQPSPPRPPGAAPSCRGRSTGCASLPGVGPYTARAVLVFAHNDDLAAVDANVRRVLSHELGLPEDLGDRDLQAVADAVLPRGRSRDWHNALMDYGSLVLTARSTGIASRSRQGTFEGSRRQKRARALRRLLAQGPQPLEELAAALGIAPGEAAEVVDGLRRDGLVTLSGGTVGVA